MMTTTSMTPCRPKRNPKHTATRTLLAMTFFVIGIAGTVPVLANEPGPRIDAAETLIHIGEIARGGIGEAVFEIMNVGDEDLRIAKVKPG